MSIVISELCVSKNCETRIHVGGGRYICDHNNLAILYPHLVQEWDFEKNSKAPNEYSIRSDAKVWWICSNHTSCNCHRWETCVKNRTLGNGCPFCNSGKPCEHNNFAIKFPELANEWDYEKNSKNPNEYAYSSNKKVWWICKNDISCNCHRWITSISCRTGSNNSGCPFCNSGRICEHNNLAIKYPELALEWDYEKNTSRPEDYSYSSGESVWWICKNNVCGCHNFFCRIAHRTFMNSGCPFCSHRKLCQHSNLLILYPDLCKEWNYEKNLKHPSEYPSGSGERVWWICSVNNKHEWQTLIIHRAHKLSECPHCSASKGYSKSQMIWLESVMKVENINIQHALSTEGEFMIPGIGKVDGFCKDTNTVYEYHGDYWHGNPSLYKADAINSVNYKTFGELYQKTIERDKKIRELGYNLIVKWETEFNID